MTTGNWRSRSPADASRGPSRWPRACSSSNRRRRPRRPPPACWARRWSPTRPGRRGSPISKVLVTVGHDIARELYLGMAIDRGLQCPVLMASTEGGVEIETVAHKTPEKILRVPVDVGLGLADFQARKICKALGLSGDTAKKGRDVLQELRQALHRHRRLARRDQPADRDGRRRRAGPRLQAQFRRQRAVPPPRHRRAARRGRGRPGRAAGRRERPLATSAWTATSPAWSTAPGWP